MNTLVGELHTTQTGASELRPLTDSELDAVSGGGPLAVLAGAGLAAFGIWLGCGTKSIPEFLSYLNE